MDVVNVEQAKIAEKAGAVAVMALERVPADIRAAGGVSRMSDPKMIEEIMNAVSIPVMAYVNSYSLPNLVLSLIKKRFFHCDIYHIFKIKGEFILYFTSIMI